MKLAEILVEKNKEDPCWDGYKQLGMKKGKGGKSDPNCVEESASSLLSSVQLVWKRLPVNSVQQDDELDGTSSWSHNTFNGASDLLYGEARVGGNVVGRVMLGIHKSLGSAEIDKLWVAMSHRGTGLATKLVHDGMRKAGIKQAFAPNLTDDGERWFNANSQMVNVDGEQVQRVVIEEAAEYQGKKVTLNKPFRTPDGPKKFAVYVRNDSGNVVIVRFGDPELSIKRDDPERRKAFRARHNCDEQTDKTSAGYWSCRQWRAGSKVEG